jgi:hypothetical protein
MRPHNPLEVGLLHLQGAVVAIGWHQMQEVQMSEGESGGVPPN